MKLTKIRSIILVFFGLVSLFTFQPNPVKAGTSGWLIKGQENVTVIPGQAFTYTVSVENAKDLSAYQLKLYYDTTRFEATSIEKDSAMTGSFVSNIATPGVIFANYANTNTVSGNRALFVITFMANEFLPMGNHHLIDPDYGYTEIVMMDTNYQTTVVDYVDYSFPEVSTAKIADVNMDGQITIVDALQIQLYLAGNIDFTDAQKVIGDVNFDGVLTILDALQIQLFLAGLRGPFEEIVIPPDETFHYYVAGSFNGWQDAINNRINEMIPIDPQDSRLGDLLAGFNATEVYQHTLSVPEAETGNSVTHIINGSSFIAYDSRMFKIIETNEYQIVMRWLQSPESGPIINLTPETIFIPPYQAELNYDEYEKSNLVFLQGGIHEIYLVKLSNGQIGIGAIRKESTQTSEQIMTEIISMLSDYYNDGMLPNSFILMRTIMFEGVVRGKLEWISSHPDIFDPNIGTKGLYNQPVEDTVITLTIVITVDSSLVEEYAFTIFAEGHYETEETLDAIYFASGMAGWEAVVGNPEYVLQMIDDEDPRYAAITAGMTNTHMVFAIDVFITFEEFGFYVEYFDADGSVKGFYESQMFKLLAVSNLGSMVWFPSDLSPEFTNLSPDFIYIPHQQYLTNPDYYFGNIGIYSGGAYTIYFIVAEEFAGIGAIVNRMTTEQFMIAAKTYMFNAYNGSDFSTLPWLAGSLRLDDETRATFTWTSSHPEIYDVSNRLSPIFNQPETDTLVIITLTILVDGVLQEDIDLEFFVTGYQTN